MNRQEALELLRQSQEFPGSYRFRVVVRAGETAPVVSAVSAELGAALKDVDERPSRKGTYTSVRLRAEVESAEQVLEVYALLEALDGVLATM